MTEAATVAASAIGAGSALSASDQLSDAAGKSAQLQRDMFNQNTANQQPYMDTGKNALSSLAGGLGLGAASGGVGQGQFLHQFNADDLKTNLAPNYDFQLKQGQGAVNNSAAAQGGLVGGNALKALNDYTQNFAGNAYQQAFNNYQTNQGNIYNRLSGLAGMGQSSAQALGNNSVGAGNNIGNAYLNQGQAQAAGTMGVGNALSQGVMGLAGGSSGGNGSNWLGSMFGSK